MDLERALHPEPLTCPLTPSLSPSKGERVADKPGEGRFMGRVSDLSAAALAKAQGRKRIPRSLCAPCIPEPLRCPLTLSLSPSEGERVADRPGHGRFMGRGIPIGLWTQRTSTTWSCVLPKNPIASFIHP